MHNSEQHPLQRQLAQELLESDWMQKYRALAHLLTTLKADVPLTQLCELKWDTTQAYLVIHCPDHEVLTALMAQTETIRSLRGCARNIILRYSDTPDVVI